jgi:hypothetical protein
LNIFLAFFDLNIQRYFKRRKEGVCVREEAIDWCIYRVIADGDARTTHEVIYCTHFESSVVESSLRRLVHAGLVTQINDLICLVPFQETVMYGQVREDVKCPVYLENGMIKVKKDQESTN